MMINAPESNTAYIIPDNFLLSAISAINDRFCFLIVKPVIIRSTIAVLEIINPGINPGAQNLRTILLLPSFTGMIIPKNNGVISVFCPSIVHFQPLSGYTGKNI